MADQALANSQSDVETLQVQFNEASGLVQQKERELREARQAADQKAKQLDVARYSLLCLAQLLEIAVHRHLLCNMHEACVRLLTKRPSSWMLPGTLCWVGLNCCCSAVHKASVVQLTSAAVHRLLLCS